MTNPKFANSGETGRTYSIPGYPPLTSVTTVLSAASKPALYGWYAKMAGVRAVEQEMEWHAIQAEEGDEAARKWISAAARAYNEQRKWLGSAVHHLCETYDEPDTDPGLLDWYLDKMGGQKDKNLSVLNNHVWQYGEFLKEHQPTFLLKEATVLHPVDRWAGTLDMVVEMGGKTYIGDIKTGGAYKETGLQLAAYRHAALIVDGDETRPFTFDIDGGFVLELKPKSYKVHYYDCGRDVYEVFLALKKFKGWLDES